MTDQEILELVDQSGLVAVAEMFEVELFAFARAIAAKERKACAAIVDAEMEENAWESNASVVLNNVAAEIRARAWADVPNASKWVDELRGNEPQPIGEIRIEHLDAPYKASQVVMHFYNELPPVGTKLFVEPPNSSTGLVESKDCYGDGNVYRGERSKDSDTFTVNFKSCEKNT